MCILLNVKKHEKTFALNVDIFMYLKKCEFALDFRKKICKNISGMSNDNEFIYN